MTSGRGRDRNSERWEAAAEEFGDMKASRGLTCLRQRERRNRAKMIRRKKSFVCEGL